MSPVPDSALRESIDAATMIALPDPTKVKAGDTATVEVIPVQGTKYSLTGEVRQVGASLWLGPVCIDMPSDDIARVTLTDHQPAPEPEQKPGTLWVDERGTRYLAGHLNGSPRMYAVDGSFVRPPLAGVRPLVVIDPAEVVDELVDSLSHALGERLPGEALAYINRVSGDDRRAWVRGLLAHAQPNLVRSAFHVLGIETPR
jgi:hypothetical protein